MKIIIIAISSLILLAFACNTTKSKPADQNQAEVEDTDVWIPQLHDIWVLTDMNGKELEGVTRRPRLELFPGDNRMGGHGGCNGLFGNIKATAQTINFSQLGSTKMYCAEEMDMEKEFLTALTQVDTYQIKGLKLYLASGEDTVLIFQKVD